MVKHRLTITINLHMLGSRLQSMNRPYIHLHELAGMLSTTPQTAGKVASMLVKLGYLEKWSRSVYRIKRNNMLVEKQAPVTTHYY